MKIMHRIENRVVDETHRYQNSTIESEIFYLNAIFFVFLII